MTLPPVGKQIMVPGHAKPGKVVGYRGAKDNPHLVVVACDGDPGWRAFIPATELDGS